MARKKRRYGSTGAKSIGSGGKRKTKVKAKVKKKGKK